jgi:uncharacterized protein YecT (DUF1311 family)
MENLLWSLIVQVLLLALGAGSRAGDATPAAGEQDANRPKRVQLCEAERFADWLGTFSVARFRQEAAAFRVPADDHCLDAGISSCKNRVPIDRAERWFAGAKLGGWVCVTNGKVSGWTPSEQLDEAPLPRTGPDEWTGKWVHEYGSAEVRIGAGREGKTLEVTGTAEWRASADAVPHLGEIDDKGAIVANRLDLGDPRCLDFAYEQTHDECIDCVARLMLINGRLFVKDNHHCGGMNVNFDGIYDRVSPEWHARATKVRDALGPDLRALFSTLEQAAETLVELDVDVRADSAQSRIALENQEMGAWVASAERFARQRVETPDAEARQRAERALNEAYRAALEQTYDDWRRTALRAAQRQWIEYRDGWVAFYRARWKGAGPPDMLQREIEMALTVERTATLRQMASPPIPWGQPPRPWSRVAR